jgi:hypothetical protein
MPGRTEASFSSGPRRRVAVIAAFGVLIFALLQAGAAYASPHHKPHQPHRPHGPAKTTSTLTAITDPTTAPPTTRSTTTTTAPTSTHTHLIESFTASAYEVVDCTPVTFSWRTNVAAVAPVELWRSGSLIGTFPTTGSTTVNVGKGCIAPGTTFTLHVHDIDGRTDEHALSIYVSEG